MEDRRSNPRRPDFPTVAPVVFDDDGSGLRRSERDGGGGDPDGRGPLRILGAIVVLGILVAVLVLPPVSILSRFGGGDATGSTTSGIQFSPRESMPDLPDGLVALSRLYDISVPEGLEGAWAMTVRLNESTTDARNLGFYTHVDGRWQRIGSAVPLDGGASAEGEVDFVPSNVAVLRRTALARDLALIVPPGERPETEGLNSASIVAVSAGSASAGGVSVEPEALEAARGAGAPAVYLGVTAGGSLDGVLGSAEAAAEHAAAIVEAAREAGADGVHLDYPSLESAQRANFTALVETLAAGLRADGLGLAVTVPTPAGGDTGAYDWRALLAAADALWLRAPTDGAAYHDQLSLALTAREREGIELGRVWLVLERQSAERTPEGVTSLTLRDALALASNFAPRTDAAIAPGDGVTLQAHFINRDEGGNTGLRWDEGARAVAFTYQGRGGPRTVWLENRYSAGFRLDLASRFGLGGVVVADAHADERLPDLWDVVIGFVEDGSVRLVRPFGPYLAPCWQAGAGQIEGVAGRCWEAEPGTEGTRGVAIWRAPDQPGVYDVTLVVSDGTVFVGQQISLRVTSEDAAEPTPTATTEPTGTVTPGPTETATPEPDPTETATPEPDPTETATPEPTETATPEPTEEATPTSTAPPGPAGN